VAPEAARIACGQLEVGDGEGDAVGVLDVGAFIGDGDRLDPLAVALGGVQCGGGLAVLGLGHVHGSCWPPLLRMHYD
jgi:hypothetical protein